MYKDRLDIELEVINSMGYAGYFLIVADFTRWAKENAVPVGPGSWFRSWFISGICAWVLPM